MKSLLTGIGVAITLVLAATAGRAQSDPLIRRDPDEGIHPFQYHASEKDLADLKHRIAMVRWPEKETVTDNSQGVPSKTIHQLADYWATKYDWRKAETKLNAYPQFITNIDGLDIHFIHVRSKEPNALPVIITHGWPGSILEQIKIIDPLTNPTAHGGKAEDAFDVVIPSMPGFGFSGKPATAGWGPDHIARAWAVLMQRLGYTRYVAQGGDWGAVVTDALAVQAPPGLIAIHTNMPGAVPLDIDMAAHAGAPTPEGLSPEEKHAYEQLVFSYQHVYYAYYMHSRPQTLTGLSDSPIGLAAFLIDHDAPSLALIARSFDGQKEGLTPDDVLDNITLFWLTNTAVSAARLYWENNRPYLTPKGVKIPVAVSAYPDELYQAPRTWVEKAYPNLIYYNKVDKGGHFAAWEQPKTFTEELRAAFRTLRN